jgi:hypothetical protein
VNSDDRKRVTLSNFVNVGGVFSAPARNVFLVKWSYWINQ